MKTHYAVALATLAGIGIGAAAVQTLHAQVKPPLYYITEIDVTDPVGFATCLNKTTATHSALCISPVNCS